MVDPIRIAIVGYGNIGKGVHKAIERNAELYGDVELDGIITRNRRRTMDDLIRERPNDYASPLIYDVDRGSWQNTGVDVAILCGGSKADLPKQGPHFARFFNTVDSFDTHEHIGPYIDEKTQKQMPGYFADMNKSARENGHLAVISAGWDPGTFSVERILGDAFIPGSNPRGFYGLTERGGLSMGHSEAIRQIKGVKDARQYTHAIPEAIERLKRDGTLQLKPGEMHWRECFVVMDETRETAAERARVENEIKTMKGYFEPYKTEVYFVRQHQLDRDHQRMPHDGVVVTSGKSGAGNLASTEYKNQWQSNPEGTAGILVACARACYRMYKEGKTGAITMLDIPPACYSPHSKEELLRSPFM